MSFLVRKYPAQVALSVIVGLAAWWHFIVSKEVPEPYLVSLKPIHSRHNLFMK